MKKVIKILIMVVFCIHLDIVFAQGCFNWVWRNPVPHGNTINAMLYDGELYWAACDGGIIMSSPDGDLWDVKMSGLNERLLGISFSPTTMVVVGEDGVNFHSFDGGSTWLPGQYLGEKDLHEVAYGNNVFLVVGENDSRFTSSDGSSWQKNQSRFAASMYDVIYDGSRFIGVGETGLVAISDDGVDWTDQTLVAGVNLDLNDIEYLNGQYVVTGEDGTVLFSSNGTDWLDKSVGAAMDLHDSFYYDGKIHVFGYRDYVSDDGGETWDGMETFQTYMYEAVNDGNLFLTGGAGGMFYSTFDGISWNGPAGGMYQHTQYDGATYGNGTYLITTSGQALTSTDGITWDRNHIYSSRFFDTIFFNNIFIVVGTGKIFTSPDGVNWTERSCPTTKTMRKLSHNGSVVVAVGQDGTIIYSSDGISWSLASYVVTDDLFSVCHGRSGLLFTRFVAVGDNGCIIYSTDGMTWFEADDTGLTTETLYGVASIGKIYVTCGGNGELYYSDGGSAWAPRTTNTDLIFYHAFNDGEGFRVVGENGMMLTSPGGHLWASHPLNISGSLLNSAVNGPQQVMVGTYGTILQREPVETILPHTDWPAPKNIEEFIEIMNDFCE